MDGSLSAADVMAAVEAAEQRVRAAMADEDRPGLAAAMADRDRLQAILAPLLAQPQQPEPQQQLAHELAPEEQAFRDALAAAPGGVQKQMVGERLYPLVERGQPQLAGKLTGTLRSKRSGPAISAGGGGGLEHMHSSTCTQARALKHGHSSTCTQAFLVHGHGLAGRDAARLRARRAQACC